MKWAEIRDVPCEPCVVGYSSEHQCEFPDYCPCDQSHRVSVNDGPHTDLRSQA